jgi:RimJ/RimL family protein N-acetyltransferase
MSIPTTIPVLEGCGVRLEPLTQERVPELLATGVDGETTRWFPFPLVDAAALRKLIDGELRDYELGTSLPFVTIDLTSNLVVGATRYLNISRPDKRVEIGSTWIARQWQRTHVNTGAKYLMLRTAFEEWNCNRVEFKTDSLNQQSRNAILRLGAIEEGTLRNHVVTNSGRIRHTVYFSILPDEWPDVKARLEQRLQIA